LFIRDKLGLLAKQTDARQKLLKLKDRKEGKMEVKTLGKLFYLCKLNMRELEKV